MTDDATNKFEAIRSAYGRAIDVAGREVANKVCVDHGARAGMHPWNRVPANKQKACTAALLKLAGDTAHNMRAAAGFAELRRESFANIGTEEKPKPKPAAKLDPVAIYSRWNTKPEKVED